MIQVGDRLPDVVLMEYCEASTPGCALGPQPVRVREAAAGKLVALFAVPGAFTPTCSTRHLPGYLQRYDELRAAGVKEIWCVSVNDAFVMHAWGREQGANGKIRMLADGSAEFARATGLTLDLTARGLGLRSNRYSMLVQDGIVRVLNVEGAGALEVSDADTLLAQLRSWSAQVG
ncbi:putative peroxiredoxin [Tepidimonas alkaliphilus]|uniref:Glutathione-dependent peroxiredoxin n=1 Tax=Tepidimonas alkaliphilus TaxID=2588942 RepID=A0A554W737_9BURK|nr:peroxiredoxin [Tepidimonas alkaliphilus]TSE19386.1 putative peroxiredoxin [Tepidimonas alkaliphilus]